MGESADNPFSIPVYPAPANLAVVPLSLLPFWLAGTLYTLLSVAAIILGIAAALFHVSPNNTLRTAVLWLVLEIIVSIGLCRTQRATAPSVLPIVSPTRLPGESGVGALKGVAA